LAALLLAHTARSDAPWLTVRGGADCSVRGEDLAARVSAAVAGTRNPLLRADVDLTGPGPITAFVRLREGSRVLGSKTLALRSCDEARDAVVAVLALALSSVRAESPRETEQPSAAVEPAESRAAPVPPLEAAPVPARAERAHPEAVPRPDDSAGDPRRARSVRLLATFGLDVGTLTHPTLLVAGGTALALGRAELRAIGRYGVPSTTEEQDVDLERLRVDFGAAALDACWGLDRARWLSACGGVELSLVRSVHTRQAAGQVNGEDVRVAAAFGPLAGLSLVLRDVPGQPQLELSAQLPLAGRAPAPGFRAALGGGLLF
jgi:hypothetical protein